jgi:hypothetical protein
VGLQNVFFLLSDDPGSFIIRFVAKTGLSALLRDSYGILSERDRATIRSALSCGTTIDYLLCFSAPYLIVNSLKLHVLYYSRLMPSFKVKYILDQLQLGQTTGSSNPSRSGVVRCFPNAYDGIRRTQRPKHFPQEPLISQRANADKSLSTKKSP